MSDTTIRAAMRYTLLDPVLNEQQRSQALPTVFGTTGPMTIGVAYPFGRRFVCIATAPGTVTVEFMDGSQGTYPVNGSASPPTMNVFPFAVLQVISQTFSGTCENWSN